MSLFGEDAIEAAARIVHEIYCDNCSECDGSTEEDDRIQAGAILDAAFAALDHDELIEKAARAIAWSDAVGAGRESSLTWRAFTPDAEHVLNHLGLLPGDTASADQREGER